MRAPLAVLPLGLLLACGGATDPSSGPYGYSCQPLSSSDSLPASARPSIPSQASTGDLNDDWAWLATHTAGCWAGAYVEPVSGTTNSYVLVLLLVDTTQFAAAVDSIRVYEPSLLTQTPGVVSMRSEQAHWSFLQLYEWFLYTESRVHFTTIGIDERGNRVHLGVGSSADSVTALGQLRGWHAPADLFSVVVEVFTDAGRQTSASSR